jgi:hypothetical protein
MTFPVKHWIIFQKRPSEVILEALCQRKFWSFRRAGMSDKEARFAVEDWENKNDLRKQYNLPKESIQFTLSADNWEIYKALNSFRKTAKEAMAFLDKHKTLKLSVF